MGGEFESSFSELAEQIGWWHQCRRPRMLHASVPEERGSIALDVWWTNFRPSATIIRQNCGFVQF